jgi:hypothetical protein
MGGPEVSLPRPNHGNPIPLPQRSRSVGPELGEVVEEQDTVVRECSLMYLEGVTGRLATPASANPILAVWNSRFPIHP